MQITIEWQDGKYPRFNVELSSKEGLDPFLKIRGCGIMRKRSDNSEFVSWPATKNETTGKYWNHVYASEAFNAAVLAEAKKTQPQQSTKTSSDSFDENSIPF